MTLEPLVLGVGSNVDPELHVRVALEDLRRRGLVLEVSPVYRSPAIGMHEGAADFLNLAVRIHSPWTASPADLKALLGEVEEAHGRIRTAGRWVSRTLDLDLLVAGNICDPALSLPHRDLELFAHTAVPVADLVGSHTHPLRGCTYTELAASVDSSALTRLPRPEVGA